MTGMSIARHHAEWLSLLEISGPFLSMPVLLRAFPQGLDAPDPDLARTLSLTYEEWLDNQHGLRPDPAIHQAWIEWVLRNVLEMPAEVISRAASSGLTERLAITVAEHSETLRPDLAIVGPPDPAKPGSLPAPRLLVQIVPRG